MYSCLSIASWEKGHARLASRRLALRQQTAFVFNQGKDYTRVRRLHQDNFNLLGGEQDHVSHRKRLYQQPTFQPSDGDQWAFTLEQAQHQMTVQVCSWWSHITNQILLVSFFVFYVCVCLHTNHTDDDRTLLTTTTAPPPPASTAAAHSHHCDW